MSPEAKKVWESPKGGRLMAAMLGLLPMGDAEKATMDEILTLQQNASAQADPDTPPEDI